MKNRILSEQLAYYRARAHEYDLSYLGGSGMGNAEPQELARGRSLLQRMGPFEQVLELACGTGIWTQTLVTIGREITAVDAAPEMLELARQKLGTAPVRYQQADLFDWEPTREYDLVFFANWLSHVPPEELEAFLAKVRRAVRPSGQLVIIDQDAPTDEDCQVAKEAIYATRPLRDGRTFTIVKVFYDLALLQDKLRRLGFDVAVQHLNDSFFLLSGARQATA